VLSDETVSNFCEQVKLNPHRIYPICDLCLSLGTPIKPKAQPGWFEADKDTLIPLINYLNAKGITKETATKQREIETST